MPQRGSQSLKTDLVGNDEPTKTDKQRKKELADMDPRELLNEAIKVASHQNTPDLKIHGQSYRKQQNEICNALRHKAECLSWRDNAAQIELEALAVFLDEKAEGGVNHVKKMTTKLRDILSVKVKQLRSKRIEHIMEPSEAYPDSTAKRLWNCQRLAKEAGALNPSERLELQKRLHEKMQEARVHDDQRYYRALLEVVNELIFLSSAELPVLAMAFHDLMKKPTRHSPYEKEQSIRRYKGAFRKCMQFVDEATLMKYFQPNEESSMMPQVQWGLTEFFRDDVRRLDDKIEASYIAEYKVDVEAKATKAAAKAAEAAAKKEDPEKTGPIRCRKSPCTKYDPTFETPDDVVLQGESRLDPGFANTDPFSLRARSLISDENNFMLTRPEDSSYPHDEDMDEAVRCAPATPPRQYR